MNDLIPYLSPSSLALFRQCPAKFKFQKIDKLPDKPVGDAAHIGTYGHEVLETFLSLPAEERSRETMVEVAKTQWEKFKESDIYQLVETSDLEFKKAVMAGLEGYLNIEDPQVVEVYESEYELLVDFDGRTLYGFVDSIVFSDDGLIARDYKFGSAPKEKYLKEKMIQPLLYAAGLRKKGLGVHRVELIYVSHGEVFGLNVSDDDIEEIVDLFKSTWDSIHDPAQEWLPKAGPLCAWCAYTDRCPKGAKAAEGYRKFRAWKGNPL